MTCSRSALIAGLVLSAAGSIANAAEPPSYAKQIKPFLAKYCLECHNPDTLKGGLDLTTFKTMQAGGEHGPVLVPGKPDESKMVVQVEGKAKPTMPPKKAKQPKPDEIALLRAWVAAGAKEDVSTLTVTIPEIKPRLPLKSPVTALAYRPDGKLLAAGLHKEVVFINPADGEVVGKLPGQTGQVTVLAFSRDGKQLAVASGSAGVVGEVRLYAFPTAGLPGEKPEHVIPAHKDLVLNLTFSPDGKLLATCGYDRLIKLWEVSTGKEVRTLKDHSDAIYGISFSPDGKLLASAAADRAVKVWDVATGRRLYTLGESTDWVYATAWSPDGKHLAAGGVDKSIRVWEATASGGRIVRSVFAHDAPITRLLYSTDGKALYSLSEDRTMKAWDTERMVERTVYPRQQETALSLAVRPDHQQLAIGRYDGTMILLDEASGKVQSEPLPVKPKPPQVTKLSPASGQRGKTIRMTFEGKHLEGTQEVVSSLPGVISRSLPDGVKPNLVRAEITFPANTPAGVYKLALKSAAGQSAQLPFTVDLFAETSEQEPNDSPSVGQMITLPATVVGSIGKAGDVDYFRFEAKAGQEIGVQILTSAVGSKLEPLLQLRDLTGRVLAEGRNGLLGYTVKEPGPYALGIRDREYRGGPDMQYRLHIGDIPVVTAVYPLGLQRGTEVRIHLVGVNLGGVKFVSVKAPANAAIGSRLPVPVKTPAGTPLGDASVVVGEFPEIVAAPAGYFGTVHFPPLGSGLRPLVSPPPGMRYRKEVASVPATANGRIDEPGETHIWRFPAKKGQRLIIEVNARRIGSPLDSHIEILDSKGQPLPRATLRCVAKTYVTFRDHDSASPGMRIETWSEFAMNDYVYVGGELLRIKTLPRNPDDDCQFFSAQGQRVGYMDTTPTHHPMNDPLYKVAIHPPGTKFSPNGMPVFTLYYRNDDGGPGYGKDSRIVFDPPADGEYQVRIGDSGGQGGKEYAYRLTVRPPRPAFTVSFNPTEPAVWKGGALPITVTADRTDGFEDAIQIQLDNLPAGFSAPATTIPAEENTTTFGLYADPKATVPAAAAPFKLVARAVIAGKEVRREVQGGRAKVVEPGDLITTTDLSEVTVRPGGQVWLTGTIERRNGYTQRVPVEVRGLPHGVRVLDIGLNGILITERESSRAFAIYCEPWVKPMEHPFVVLVKSERKGAEHAAKSVLLKVVAPAK